MKDEKSRIKDFIRHNLKKYDLLDSKQRIMLNDVKILVTSLEKKNDNETYSMILRVVLENKSISAELIGRNNRRLMLSKGLEEQIKIELAEFLRINKETMSDKLSLFIITNKRLPYPNLYNHYEYDLAKYFLDLDKKDKPKLTVLLDESHISMSAEILVDFINKEQRYPSIKNGEYEAYLAKIYNNYAVKTKVQEIINGQNLEQIRLANMVKTKNEDSFNNLINYLKENNEIPKYDNQLYRYLINTSKKRPEMILPLINEYPFLIGNKHVQQIINI